MLSATTTILAWASAVLVILGIDEVVRALAIRRFQRRLRRSVERAIREKGVRLGLGRDARMANLVCFEVTFLDVDEVPETLRMALGILDRRGIVRLENERITVDPARRSLLKYRAHSVDHYFDPRAPAALLAREA